MNPQILDFKGQNNRQKSCFFAFFTFSVGMDHRLPGIIWCLRSLRKCLQVGATQPQIGVPTELGWKNIEKFGFKILQNALTSILGSFDK